MSEEILFRIFASLHAFHQKVDKLMASIDDLNAAVSNLQTAWTAAAAEIQSELQQLSTANANNDSAAVEAAAQSINSIVQNMNSTVAAAQTPPSTTTTASATTPTPVA